MKTEQEQIEQIEKVLKYAVADYKHLKKKGVCYCYAETLIESGYGDVSEYKAEIERLKADLDHQIDATNDAENLASHLQYDLDETRKQAQIDVLNKLKDRYGLYYLSVFGVKERMLADILNPMIEELKK